MSDRCPLCHKSTQPHQRIVDAATCINPYCPQNGQIVRFRNVIVLSDYPVAEAARFRSIDDAMMAASLHLGLLLGAAGEGDQAA